MSLFPKKVEYPFNTDLQEQNDFTTDSLAYHYLTLLPTISRKRNIQYLY